jgi:hypothetical protein
MMIAPVWPLSRAVTIRPRRSPLHFTARVQRFMEEAPPPESCNARRSLPGFPLALPDSSGSNARTPSDGESIEERAMSAQEGRWRSTCSNGSPLVSWLAWERRSGAVRMNLHETDSWLAWRQAVPGGNVFGSGSQGFASRFGIRHGVPAPGAAGGVEVSGKLNRIECRTGPRREAQGACPRHWL